MGRRRLASCCAIFAVTLAALLANSSFWLWTVFSLDYFLGNPSFFREYRDELFEREYANMPVKEYVKPQTFLEINGSDYSFPAFQVLSNNFRHPVLIRGLFKGTPMLKWTPHYLADHFRQANRTFLVLTKNDFNAGGISTFSHLDSEWMPLDQMINNISAGGTNYLQNANLYFPEDSPLYREMELKNRTGFDRETFLIQFFLGRKNPGEKRGSGSSLHAAAAPNLFIQISASKHWIMFHPKWSRYVLPRMFNYQVAAGSVAGLSHQADGERAGKSRWGTFPRWEGTVHPGDALWVPGWWWHEVQNIPSEDWSLAAATRYSTYFQLWENNPLFTFLADFGTKEKPCLPGTRFICAALHPGVENGKLVQTHSGAAHEAVVRKLLNKGVLEKNAE